MGKRGVALIMVFLVIVVISILSGAFLFNVINENTLVNRYINSTRALWLAEAGIAEAVRHMPDSTSGSLGGASYTYSTGTNCTTNPCADYYQIDSVGTVNLGASGTISRSLSAIVRTDPVDPNHFQHAIRTTSDLVIKGSVDINGPSEEFASLNFADLFDYGKEDMRSFATHLYTNPANDVTPVDGITWVDLSPGSELRISSNTWSGSGILVVAGDAQITGGTFDGIIYVIGKLRMSGNPVINGTILAESKATIDTFLTGNVTINYNPTAITNALNFLEFIAPVVVSWQEN